MIPLDFFDTVTIYPISKDAYGNDVAGQGVTVPALFNQTTGYAHSSGRDSISSASTLFLPGDDAFVAGHYERLEGMIVQVSPFGGNPMQQLFRITDVAPATDNLIDSDLQHVVCKLAKIAGVKNVS